MTPAFQTLVTPHFERLMRRLQQKHPDLAARYGEVLRILREDPLNRRGTHAIRKLQGVQPGEGQYIYHIKAQRGR